MKRFIATGALALTLAAAQWLAVPGAALAQSETDAADPAGAPHVVEMTLGAEDAPVSVTEYASFTCPHCATFHDTTFKQLKENYIDTGKVAFTYRDVYFDRYGLWASMVARCGGQERFFGIAGVLYDKQREWLADTDPVAVSDALRRIGKVAGLDEAQLDACLADEDKAKALVEWFQANAEADEITSTPSLVIDGKTYGNMNYADLSEIIDGKLDE